jgi:predicted kinase
MKILILTVGLPQSGKSTWAKQTGHPIVNRDAIRKTIGGTIRYFKEENRVTDAEHLMVESLFHAGHETVVIDATHLKKKYRDKWKVWCANRAIKVDYKIFMTPMDICIERSIMNYPEETQFPRVIRDMWHSHLTEKGFDGEFPFFIPKESDPINIDIGG